jgi:Flp pilus assembly secretin CpaC
MNKNNTCALFVLSLTSIASLSILSDTPANAAPAHKHKAAQAGVLPELAGTTSPRVASSMHLSTIPLIPGIGQPTNPVAAQVATSGAQSVNKTMNVGDSEIFEFDKISTTAVGDPTVADITPLSTTRLLVSAKGTGHTTIFVYDQHGRNTISVTVLPSENTQVLASKIEEEIGIPTVTVRAVNDSIFLEGSAPTQSASSLAEAIAKAYTSKVVNLIVVGETVHERSEAERYADLLNENLNTSGITAQAFDDHTIILKGKYAKPTGHSAASNEVSITDDMPGAEKVPEATDPLDTLLKSLPADIRIINLINFERQEQRQVLVRAKIVDIDRTSTKNLGIDWGTSNFTAQQVGSSQATQIVDQFTTQPILFSQMPGGMFGNLLGGGGPLKRTMPWAAQLNALIRENKARILSQPSLMVLDGNQASMLVGGEFPVPIMQGSAGGAITVQFKPFGVRLNVAPVVVSDDTIQLTVTPEVSDIDFSNAVTFNGSVIPGVTIRRATSTLQMKDGQTLVIGGLYSNNYGKNVNKIPFLSSIPILGEFFKSTSTNKTERELLVMLEAEIVTPGTLGATPPPAGSLENMDIQKPFVPRKEFNQDSPDIQNGPFHVDHEAPNVPVEMPGTGK